MTTFGFHNPEEDLDIDIGEDLMSSIKRSLSHSSHSGNNVVFPSALSSNSLKSDHMLVRADKHTLACTVDSILTVCALVIVFELVYFPSQTHIMTQMNGSGFTSFIYDDGINDKNRHFDNENTIRTPSLSPVSMHHL